MKRHGFQSICFLLSFLIICLGSGGAAAEQAGAARDEIMQAYQDVLLGRRSYILHNDYDEVIQETTMAGEIAQWCGFMFDPPLHYTAFAVSDLDSDGSPDVLLQLSGDFGFELLRYDNGQVYGFPFVARAMEAVTVNGDIHGSNGAENFGWYLVRFEGAAIGSLTVCWQYDDLGDGIVCMIGDTEVSQDEFTALNNELWDKKTVDWIEFSAENLAAALSGE